MWGLLAFLLLDPAAPPPRCDAAAITERANELWAMGQEMAALVEYENAIRCAPSVELHRRAAAVACRISRGREPSMLARAKRHLDQLPAQHRDQIVLMCQPPCDPFWDMRD